MALNTRMPRSWWIAGGIGAVIGTAAIALSTSSLPWQAAIFCLLLCFVAIMSFLEKIHRAQRRPGTPAEILRDNVVRGLSDKN